MAVGDRLLCRHGWIGPVPRTSMACLLFAWQRSIYLVRRMAIQPIGRAPWTNMFTCFWTELVACLIHHQTTTPFQDFEVCLWRWRRKVLVLHLLGCSVGLLLAGHPQGPAAVPWNPQHIGEEVLSCLDSCALRSCHPLPGEEEPSPLFIIIIHWRESLLVLLLLKALFIHIIRSDSSCLLFNSIASCSWALVLPWAVSSLLNSCVWERYFHLVPTWPYMFPFLFMSFLGCLQQHNVCVRRRADWQVHEIVHRRQRLRPTHPDSLVPLDRMCLACVALIWNRFR